MLRLLLTSALIASIFWIPLSNARCPELSGKDLAYYICPGLGSGSNIPVQGIIYKSTSKPGVWDVCSGIKNAFTKLAVNSDKPYIGDESEVSVGTLVCKYDLPESWKVATKSLTMTATIDGPHMPAGALCPSFTFDELGKVLCGASQTSFGIEWKISEAGAGESVCNFFKGAVSKLRSSPHGEIYGQLGNGTVPFSHTCNYVYHKSSGEAVLTIKGTQDLDHLRKANHRLKEKHHGG